jgi:hypothetical protein
MDALATVVPGRGDDEHTTVFAQMDSSCEKVIWFEGKRTLTAANVNDVRTFLNCLFNGPRQIQLSKSAGISIRKNRGNEASTVW